MAKRKSSKQTKLSLGKKSSATPSYLLPIFVAFIAFLMYSNTLSHEWALDDYSAIKENYVTQDGFAGIPTIWKEHYRFGYWNSAASLYRPLTLTVFAVIWQFAPDNPFYFHLVNVLFFAFTGALIFMVLKRLLSSYHELLALAISLIFVAHPIHVEVVANIKSLDEILALFFCLKAIYLLWNYLETGKIFWQISAIMVYGLALFSKESAITFVAIIPLTLYFFSSIDAKKNAILSSTFLLPTFLFLIIRQQIVGSFGVGDSISILDNVIMGADGAIASFATAMLFMGRYLLNLVLPVFLGHDLGYHTVPLADLGNWQALLSIILYVGMGLFALLKIIDKNIVSYGIWFYLITFAPLCNVFIPIGTCYGERIAYMPSLGFIIAMVFLIFIGTKSTISTSKLPLSEVVNTNKLGVLMLAVFFAFYSFQTINRNTVWKNSYTLYDADIKTYPNGAKLNYHYGLELVKFGLDATNGNDKQKWMQAAHNQFVKATEIYPEYHDAYGQLGLSMYRAKQYDKALEYYQKSVDLKPNNAKVLSNMGIIYFERGETEKARQIYERAVKIDPRFVDAQRNLGSVYAQLKNFPKAIEHFSAAYQYAKEDATINFYLGSAYRDAGRASEGQAYLDRACQLNKQFCK